MIGLAKYCIGIAVETKTRMQASSWPKPASLAQNHESGDGCVIPGAQIPFMVWPPRKKGDNSTFRTTQGGHLLLHFHSGKPPARMAGSISHSEASNEEISNTLIPRTSNVLGLARRSCFNHFD